MVSGVYSRKVSTSVLREFNEGEVGMAAPWVVSPWLLLVIIVVATVLGVIVDAEVDTERREGVNALSFVVA